MSFYVFGAKSNSGCEGGIYRTKFHFVAANAKFAGGSGVEAENGGGNFAASGADQSGKSQNFARA